MTKETRFKVEDMKCDHCVARVRQTVLKLPLTLALSRKGGEGSKLCFA